MKIAKQRSSHFNSMIVRLKATFGHVIDLPEENFNSMIVRLKEKSLIETLISVTISIL